jgi:urease accessory protein
MLRATAVRPRDEIRASEKPADSIALDHTARHRRRVVFTAAGGLQFLLDLERAHALRDGDGLVLEDGRVVLVKALPEPLLEVRGKDARHLAALAWQIGNRHLEAQIESARILIRRDHVIADMLRGLGAELREIEEIFEPEAGAYSHGHTNGHHHDH